MTTPSELWPPFGLTVQAGDLTLTTITDDDLPGLVDLARSGIHDEGFMPFGVPWTLAPAEDLPRRYAAHYWTSRATFTLERLALDLAVRRNGELVGVQGFSATDYPVTRSAETGSWLARRFQGQGIGTQMRQAVCALLFDHLGAAEVTSGAFVDNAASLGVSRKVGYREGDVTRMARQGELALHRRLVLRPEDLVRGDPVEVTGVEPLRAFFGLDQAG